jgi:hypothetical protein
VRRGLRHSREAPFVHLGRWPLPRARWPAAVGPGGPLLLPSEGLPERERFTRRTCAPRAYSRWLARPDHQAVRSAAATRSTGRTAPPSRCSRSRISR